MVFFKNLFFSGKIEKLTRILDYLYLQILLQLAVHGMAQVVNQLTT